MTAARSTCVPAIKHGHFGPKLHRSLMTAGSTDLAGHRNAGIPGDAATRGSPTLTQIWTLENRRAAADHPGLGSGSAALPAGLFRYRRRGWAASNYRARTVGRAGTGLKWFERRLRRKQQGIHSVLPDPRVPGRVSIAIILRRRVGHIRRTARTGRVRGKGLVATYMPPEQARRGPKSRPPPRACELPRIRGRPLCRPMRQSY